MHIIIYTSEYKGEERTIDQDLINITTAAKRHNVEYGITGLLFYHNGRFLQIIEGPQKSLESLMDILETDTRHRNIERIIDEPIRERGFRDWNMDSFNLSDTEKIDPQELRVIRDVYKRNMTMESGFIDEFYKAMLETHDLAV